MSDISSDPVDERCTRYGCGHGLSKHSEGQPRSSKCTVYFGSGSWHCECPMFVPRDISSDPITDEARIAHLKGDAFESDRDISSVTGSDRNATCSDEHNLHHALYEDDCPCCVKMLLRDDQIADEAVDPWRKFVEAYLGNAHEDELIAWAEDLLEDKTHE